jgi:hypothetical protein
MGLARDHQSFERSDQRRARLRDVLCSHWRRDDECGENADHYPEHASSSSKNQTAVQTATLTCVDRSQDACGALEGIARLRDRYLGAWPHTILIEPS